MIDTPKQTVAKSFESREKLVAQLVDLADMQRGDTTKAEVKSRLMGLSNQKLLRLHKVEQRVRERFGDREKLVEHILGARRAAGVTADDAYAAKLATFSKGRLLDLVRVRLPAKQEKQTPEQKLAKKRGKKARERALSKIRGA